MTPRDEKVPRRRQAGLGLEDETRRLGRGERQGEKEKAGEDPAVRDGV
jgi:hypothetical protein